MTENKAKNATLEIDTDWLLQYFVVLANKSEIGIGVTLNVGGLIVSGELVSEKRYFEGIAQEMAAANADDVLKNAFQTAFRHMASQYEPQTEASEEDKLLPVFIHLKNAKIYPSIG